MWVVKDSKNNSVELWLDKPEKGEFRWHTANKNGEHYYNDDDRIGFVGSIPSECIGIVMYSMMDELEKGEPLEIELVSKKVCDNIYEELMTLKLKTMA